MLKQLFTLLFVFITAGGIYAQKVVEPHYADTVIFKSKTGKTEIVYKNATDTIPGFLYNAGKDGRLIFKRGLARLNDSTYVIGADTLKVKASSVDLSPYYKRMQVDSTVAANKPDLSPYSMRQEVDTAKQHLRDLIATKPDSISLVIDNSTIIGDGSDENPLRVNDSLITASSRNAKNADSLNHIAGNLYLQTKDTTGKWQPVGPYITPTTLPGYLQPSVTTKRVFADTTTSGLLYPPAPFPMDALSITATANRGLLLKPPVVFTGNNQTFIGVEISPVNQTPGGGGAFSNTTTVALRVGGSIIPSSNGGGAVGTNSAVFGSGYFTTAYTSNLRAITSAINFQLFDGTKSANMGGNGNWCFGNPSAYGKLDMARISIQGDQYSIGRLGRGMGIDDTLRPSLTGDTLIGLDVAPVYDLTGAGAIATVTSSGTTTANGSWNADFNGGSGKDGHGIATVSGGTVTAITITSGGKNYKVGDVLTASYTPGISYTVTSIGAIPNKVLAARFNNDIELNYTLPAPGATYQVLVKDATNRKVSQVPASSLVPTEYLDYQSGNYTVNASNGNVQNIVFQLSAAATLTLPSPATNLVVYVSNMSNNQLTCSQNIYTTDATWQTFITNQMLKLVWSASRAKWYILSN
jgi:hypothetical protein